LAKARLGRFSVLKNRKGRRLPPKIAYLLLFFFFPFDLTFFFAIIPPIGICMWNL
jgi:hypothetical protein